MQFLHPWALWLLPLIAVPLLLSRDNQPASRLEVSNLYLWRMALGRNSQTPALRRVRRSWLVALQMMAIAAAVLALSVPVTTMAGGRTALVFDVSASMAARANGITRLEEARRRARAIVSDLTSASRVIVIAAGDSPRDLGDYAVSDPRLLGAIEALEPMPAGSDLPTAVVTARARDTNRVVVLSDAAATLDTTGGEFTGVEWVHVGQPVDNATVARIAARPAALGARGGQVLAVVRNFARVPRQAAVEIAVDGRVVRQLRAELPPVGRTTLDIALPDLGHTVTATLTDGDALSLDDARSMGVRSAEPTRVALIGPAGSFLEKALAVNPSVMLERFDSGSRAAIEVLTSREDLDVVVCDGCPATVPATRPALMLTPATRGSTPGLLTLANREHPVVASLNLGDLSAAATAEVDGNADVILRAGGAPAVTAVDRDGRRRVNLHLDLSRQDLVLNAVFPVLIANAIDWLAAPADEPDEGVPDGESNLLASASVVAGGPGDNNPAVSSREPVPFAPWLALVALLSVAAEWRLRMTGAC